MRIPPISNPERYVGLYVYDFETHVSVGYTALEIRYLRESETYRGGTAYQIYRVTETGGLELRGASDERLTAREAICFLRADAAAARRDYDSLRQLAEQTPLPCAVTLQLAKNATYDPPNVTALLYPASATTAIANWLEHSNFAGGDRVVAGIDVHAEMANIDTARIDSCQLPSLIDYTDRPAEEVLRRVHQPLQR